MGASNRRAFTPIFGPISRLETRIRLGIAVLVLSFAVVGLAAVFAEEGSSPGLDRIVACVTLLSTIPVALIVSVSRRGFTWTHKPDGGARAVAFFTAYADIGVAIVLFTFVDHTLGLVGVMLLSAVSTYVGHFGVNRILVWHMVFITVVALVLFALAFAQNEHSTLSLIARLGAVLIAANGTVFLTYTASRTIRRNLHRQIVRAQTDPLTSTLNLRGLYSQATRLITSDPSPIGCMLIDVDRFKTVNDTYGHMAGDRVLTLAAGRLLELFDGRGIVARRGGEEFTIVLPIDPSSVVSEADTVRQLLSNPSDSVPITVSIGVSIIAAGTRLPEDGYDIVTTGMHHADVAMYRAKAAGRDRVMQFG